jgi:hypothetical protein
MMKLILKNTFLEISKMDLKYQEILIVPLKML